MSERGDFFLVQTRDFWGALIRLGTRSPVNHAGIFLTDTWMMEADPHFGIRAGQFSKYADCITFESYWPLTDAQRILIGAKAVELEGVKYGFLDIAALTLRCTVGLKWKWLDRIVQRQDRLICSQFVAVCYAAAGIELVPGKPSMYVTPGDLAIALLGKTPVSA